jgi:glycosyltransferase involved in cell wall biosynthesis
MADTPLVSVVVPSYCHQDHVIECLQSVHAQTWPHLELVVIDDASTDQSWPRLQALFASPFAQRFERATLLRNDQNVGAHATLNRGIDTSQGSHIALLNSDDLYHPNRIHRLMQALENGGDIGQGGHDLAFSLVEIRVDDPAPPQIDPFFRLFTLRQHLALRRDPTVGLSLMRANHAISTGNLLFTRDLWHQIGPFQPLHYCHDWDFLLQALYVTEPAVVTEPLYTYRLHGTNSFSALTHRQDTELEITSRRFLRRGLTGKSPNPLFPSEANWPGFFDHFVKECHLDMHLRLERGDGRKGWRIYD